MSEEKRKAKAEVLKQIYALEDTFYGVNKALNEYRSVADGYDWFTKHVEHFMVIADISRNHLMRLYSREYEEIMSGKD